MQVQVLDFDEYTKKASLSMRTLEEENIAYLSVIAFRMTVISLALPLLLRVFRHGLRKPSSFYLIKR